MSSEVQRRSGLVRQRLVSWGIGCAIVGWLVVYNVIRITSGDSPRSAAIISVGTGLALGAVLFAILVVSYRWLAARGWVHPEPLDASGAAGDPRAGRAVRVVGGACIVLAVVSVAVGVVLLSEWLGAAAGERSAPKIVIAVWDLFAAVWLAYEPVALFADDTADIDAIALAGMITAVLGGVAISRGMIIPAQVVLIPVAGIVSALAQFAFWRVGGSRGITLAPVGSLAVAALALVLPLAV